MEEEQPLLKFSTPVKKVYLGGYIVASFTLIALTIAAVSLSEWYTYCYWDFGLVRANTFLKNSAFRSEDTISDVRADSCYGLKDTIEDACPDFCKFPLRFELAGALLILLTIVSILSQIFSTFYHFVRYRRLDFKLKSARFLVIFTFTLQFAAFMGYYFIAGFYALKDTKNTKSADLQGDETKHFEWKAGMGMYLTLVVLQFLLMIFGLIFTAKGFK